MSKDGFILPDSKIGRRFGFTSKRFSSLSYLTKSGNAMIVSFIRAREEGKGHFRTLMKNIEKLGLDIIIPTPSNRMVEIGKKNGYEIRAVDFGDDEVIPSLVKEIRAVDSNHTEGGDKK